jgi:hypothetical protein
VVAGKGSAGITDHDRLFEGSPLNTSLQDVLPLIDNAFAGTQRDENCTIHQAQLADETLDREIPDEEWLVAKRQDPGIDWRDVPANSLDECDAAMSHATPTSWLFYLPAYMKRALELLNVNSEGSNLPNSVMFHLILDRGSSGPSFYVFERFKQITPAQDERSSRFSNTSKDIPPQTGGTPSAPRRRWTPIGGYRKKGDFEESRFRRSNSRCYQKATTVSGHP